MLLNSEQISHFVSESETSKRAQVGIDLSVKEIKRIIDKYSYFIYKDKTVIDPKNFNDVVPFENEMNEKGWYLTPGAYSITFHEGIKIPTNKTAFVLHRSSLYRMGNFIVSPVWDPGFECENMNTTLIINNGVWIEEGARLAQVIFHENYEADAYNGQWQGLSSATHKNT